MRERDDREKERDGLESQELGTAGNSKVQMDGSEVTFGEDSFGVDLVRNEARACRTLISWWELGDDQGAGTDKGSQLLCN